MFRRKNKAEKKQIKRGILPDAAPGDIAQNVADIHYGLGAHARIQAARWFFISCVMGLALTVSVAGYALLLPLKTVETFMVTKTDGGRLVVDTAPVGNWEPDSDSITYFLNKWAASMWDVNRATIENNVRESASFAISHAATQLQEFRHADNPIVNLNNTQGYNRTYEFLSINYMRNDVGLLRLRTITREGSTTTARVYLMTITFTRIKPRTLDQVLRNPAGIYITSFNISEESADKAKPGRTQ